MSIRSRALVSLSLAAVAVTGLAGCTPASKAAGPTAGSTAASTKATTSTDPAADPAVPTIPTGAGIIAATTMTGCDTKGTSVTARGTVTMPKDKKGDVVISVSWVNSGNSSVYVRGLTTLTDPKPGEKKNWSITASLPEEAESVSCVLGAVIPE